jgi:hypothetical protein
MGSVYLLGFSDPRFIRAEIRVLRVPSLCYQRSRAVVEGVPITKNRPPGKILF